MRGEDDEHYIDAKNIIYMEYVGEGLCKLILYSLVKQKALYQTQHRGHFLEWAEKNRDVPERLSGGQALQGARRDRE